MAELRRAALSGLKHPASFKVDPKIPNGPDYQEAITINAKTGIPLQIASGPARKPSVIVSYVITRASLADIAAGKF